MRSFKSVILGLLLLGLCIGANAQSAGSFIQSNIISVSGAVAQGSMNQGNNIAVHNLSWTIVATVSACTVQLETSSDNISFSLMSGTVAQTCTSSGSYRFNGTSANFVRVNFTALTVSGGGTLSWTYTGSNQPGLPPIAYSINCGLTTTCTPVNVPQLRIIYGSCTAAAATTCTVTAIAPAFTSSSSYFCVASDATTAANGALKITYASATSFVITTSSSSDVFNYLCWGT